MTRTCLGAFAARVLAAKVGTAAFLLALAALLAAPMLAVAQVPGAPTNLTATADGQAAIDLEWDAPTATGGSTITGYKIEWSADGNDPWMVLVADTGSADTEYTDADSLMGGTTRHYRVSAINDEGPGTASTVASGTTDYQLLSPNGHVEVTIQLQDGSLHYSIDHRQEQLVTPSAVGMAFSEDLDDVGDVTIVGTDTRENDTTWTPVWGKTSEVTDHFRESSVSLQEVVPPQRVFDVVFRAYDDGVAFRYHVPSQTNLEDGDVLRERTYFNFAGNWPVHSVGRTEYPPGGPTPIDDFGSSNTPMLVLPDSGALAVHEAALLDYPVMHLMGSAENPHSVLAHVDSVTFSELLWTPWRVLLVASDLGRLLETQLLETLSPPSSIADTSFVRPGKAIFDRRIRKLTYGDVYYWFNTAAYIHMIDFAARNGIAYLAIDSNWYGVQRDPLSNPMTAVTGLDIEAVLAHAKNNGIRVILYVNDMAFDNYDMDEVFAKYREWGVGGVKYGFMRGNERSEAKVVKTVAAIELAARHQLLIKFHDNPIHPTGLQRTYPNLVSVEYSHGQLDAVRTFTPEDYLRTIFVHMLAGPLDMNNGYFALDSIHTRTNGGLQYNRTYPQLYSTVTAETARILITDTGLTVLPDAPEEYERKDDLFEFVRRMPNAPWDDTRVLHAEFGVHVTTARRHGLEWFIGSVVNEDGGSLDIALDFLEAGVTYAATLYEDAEDTHYQTNREAYRVRQTTVVVGDTISAAMAPGGGHAIWLRPKTGPVFSGGDAFAVAENETFVGRVNAEDSGSRYRIGGGADQSTFEIASTSGLLTFRTAPNFEDPQDADSNNTYVVVVRATSGAGAMELEAEQTFTVSVTDELEPPGIPEAPSFSGETAESLQVSWSKPDNTGPAITDYDVQYREKGTEPFSDGQHEGPGLSLMLDDLEPGTVYEVQVLASNDEGTSNWSESGEGITVTPTTVSKLEITSDPGTDRTYAAGDEIQVTVTFSETVEVTGTPQLRLELGGGQRTADYGGGSGTAALVFGYTVAGGESDTDGVGVEADSLSGGTIRDGAGHNAVLEHEAVTPQAGHKVDGVKPELAATGGEVVNGTTLTLTYDEPLDGSSTPATGDFTVSGGDQMRTVTGVRVNGSAVELTLDVGAEHEEAGILVSYTPGMKPIRDVAGNQAEGLSQVRVTNETPDTTPPEVESLGITSNPGSDQTYAEGDEIEVTVRFDETVEVEGAPQLSLRVGTRTRTAGYDSGTGTAALVFAYEVADGDEDTGGVSIEAGRIALNGGTIEDEAENAAVLDHEALATQAGHKVDGVRPAFVSAAVDGSSLTLTYGEGLDGGSRPASGDFTVTVDGAGRTVSGVDVDGSAVTLTINPAVEHGDTGIRVSYTPDTNPIRDAVGNDALGLSSRSVTNTTGAPNTDPQITSPSSFEVPENQAMVRRLAARDTDPGDEVTGWTIVGGADQGQFTITSATGDLSFRTAPDFEAPGDNEYEVTVEVSSGAGARELEAEQTITLRVTDEREPPEVPEAPVISGETADSLQVSWNEPDNTGPAITDYDVQYREKGTGRFSDGDHEGPGLTLTLTDLKPGTVYEVQVRATNDEGTSNWSESGEGMTITPLTVQMTSDLPPPVSGPFTVQFSFSEPVTGFSASDIEMGQDPACTDDQNNTFFCDPGIGSLETADDRVIHHHGDAADRPCGAQLHVDAGRFRAAR